MVELPPTVKATDVEKDTVTAAAKDIKNAGAYTPSLVSCAFLMHAIVRLSSGGRRRSPLFPSPIPRESSRSSLQDSPEDEGDLLLQAVPIADDSPASPTKSKETPPRKRSKPATPTVEAFAIMSARRKFLEILQTRSPSVRDNLIKEMQVSSCTHTPAGRSHWLSTWKRLLLLAGTLL